MKKKSQLEIYQEKIEKYLREKGLSKAAAARTLGVDNSTFHRWFGEEERAAELAKKLESPESIANARSDKLSGFAVEDLVDELSKRGWTVNLTRKTE